MPFSSYIWMRHSEKTYGFKIGPIPGSPSSTTLYVSTDYLSTWVTLLDFDGVVLDHSNITYEMRVGSPVANISDMYVKLRDVFIVGQTAGSTLTDLFESHDFHNAPVVAYILVHDLGRQTKTAWYDQAIWHGNITDWVIDHKEKTVTLRAEAMLELEERLPDTVITLADHPDPPDSSVGIAEPLVYGDFGVDCPETGETDADKKALELMGINDLRHVLPTVCIDAASGSAYGTIKMRAAGHALKAFPDNAGTYGAFVRVDEAKQLAVLTSGPTFTNAAAGSDLEIDLGAYEDTYKIWVVPQWIAAGNTALNPGNAVDGDTSTYATCGTTSANTTLFLDFPQPPDLGYIAAFHVMVYLDHYIQVGNSWRFGLWDPSGGGAWLGNATINGTGALVSKLIQTAVWASPPPYVDQLQRTLQVYGHAATLPWIAGDYVYVREIRVVVGYYPRHFLPRFLQPYGGNPRTPSEAFAHAFWLHKKGGMRDPISADEALGLDESEPTIFVSALGIKDDGSGTITGTADKLLECPAHIVHDILKNQLGITAIETSGHGDLGGAGYDQNNDGLFMAIAHNDQMPARELISKISRQGGMGLFQRPNGNYGVVYLGCSTADNDYGTPIVWDDVIDFEVSKTPISEVRNDIHIDFDYAYMDKKFAKHCYQNKDGDDDGMGGSYASSTMDFTTSESHYGRRSWNLRADYLWWALGAIRLRNLYCELLVLPRVRLRMKLPLKFYDLEVGHLITIDDTSFRVDNGIRYPGTLGGSYPGQWSEGSDYHWFWVERVTYDKRGFMEIEASEAVFPHQP